MIKVGFRGIFIACFPDAQIQEVRFATSFTIILLTHLVAVVVILWKILNIISLNAITMIIFRNTRNYHPLSLNTILYGKSTLNDDDNSFLFQAVQQCIKDTKRFE